MDNTDLLMTAAMSDTENVYRPHGIIFQKSLLYYVQSSVRISLY